MMKKLPYGQSPPEPMPPLGRMRGIAAIEGIGKVYAEKLAGAGLTGVEALLKAGASPQGREALVEETGISGKLILEWVNLADLFRIKGVGEEYSDLLEEAGVDTVPELAQRNAENLYAKLQEVNATKALVRRLPARKQVADWIEQAKRLPRIVTY
jgi:predicted flap endonuclease-1-like 5' DNA nuclease